MPNLVYYSCDEFYSSAIDYIYEKHGSKINDIYLPR